MVTDQVMWAMCWAVFFDFVDPEFWILIFFFFGEIQIFLQEWPATPKETVFFGKQLFGIRLYRLLESLGTLS